MAYILIQRAQKRHNLVEKPLKMADFLQYLLWRPYAKIYQKDTRNLQETHRILFETHRILFKTHRMLFKTHRILFKTKIYEKKYKKSASSFNTQTGYISR